MLLTFFFFLLFQNLLVRILLEGESPWQVNLIPGSALGFLWSVSPHKLCSALQAEAAADSKAKEPAAGRGENLKLAVLFSSSSQKEKATEGKLTGISSSRCPQNCWV